VAPADTFGLSKYRIYRDNNAIAETTLLRYQDLNMVNGTYTYRVTALYAELESVATEDISVPLLVPYAVSDVVAELVAQNVQIAWNPVPAAANHSKYKVWALLDTQQMQPATWIFVTEVADSLNSCVVQMHATSGNLLWAVIAVYGEIESLPVFSNILSLEPDAPPIPEVTKLLGNYPNPFNPPTRIAFWLHQDSPVKIAIYNNKGQHVRTLVNEDLRADYYSIPWDGKDKNGRNVNSGVYIYRFSAKGYNKTMKMTILR
ncbi:MAG: FlgD immunoglobulin-like domain containing protein, partial [Candidatus Cloacimonadaceae bacterium]|nr:FlgD immunoglobulin-like domain containing protein [Candidatus Cloacimonadaceae bacterium]